MSSELQEQVSIRTRPEGRVNLRSVQINEVLIDVSIRTRPEGRVNQQASSPLMYNAFSVVLREPDRQAAKAVTKSVTKHKLSHGISALSTREPSHFA